MKVEKRTFSSWQALSALALGAFVVEFGCAVEKEDNVASQGEDVEEDDDLLEDATDEVSDALMGLLEDTWPSVIDPTLVTAESSIAELKTAIEAWQNDSGSAEAKENAQAAWTDALRAWQVLEVMQIGPAASSIKALGGQDIRDNIYSWPVTNSCRVDQVTCREDFLGDTYFDTALPNVMGFDALETLLFSAPNENSCSSQSGINRDGEWEAVGAEGIAQSRADFAATLTDQIAADLQRIRTAWEDGFGEELATAGQSSTVYDSASKGLNAIYDGLFYVETFVKDRKLGWPLNERDCGQEDCTDEVESRAAGASHEWLAANLEGFRTLYTGGEGRGMYDLLVSIEEEALAESVLAKLDDADAAVAGLTVGLNDTVRSDPEKLREVYDAVKDVTDLLKIDIPAVLSLQVPSEAAGDND